MSDLQEFQHEDFCSYTGGGGCCREYVEKCHKCEYPINLYGDCFLYDDFSGSFSCAVCMPQPKTPPKEEPSKKKRIVRRRSEWTNSPLHQNHSETN